MLWLTGCEALPELNSKFELTSKYSDFDDTHATYKGPRELLCFYWRFSKLRVGWWIGSQFGSNEGLIAHAKGANNVRAPPSSGWHVQQGDRRVSDPAQFVKSEPVGNELEVALEQLDCVELMGKVTASSLLRPHCSYSKTVMHCLLHTCARS